MKNVTVRGIDPVLAEKLRQEAKSRDKSVNQVIIDALKLTFKLQKEKKYTVVHHDLDHLFGSWSPDEYERIQGSVDAHRKIDPELWQ